jgi:Pyruvate/2-oxoacid:ferredoxin oxidoreductase delta subunit
VDEIYPRVKDLGITKKDLTEILDSMAKKGVIGYYREGKQKFYGNVPWVLGIYEYQVDKLTPELVADIRHYYQSPPTEKIKSTEPSQMRTIPVGQSFRRDDSVTQYDDVQHLIEQSEGPFIVANCICRQEKDILGEPCQVSDNRELCFGIGKFTQGYLDLGWAREISKEEMLAALEKNKAEGLVLRPSNTQEIEFVCNCCGCCCGGMYAAKAAHRPVDYFTTNYSALVDSDLCTSCGTCVNLCQMEAITLGDESADIDLDRCIGCGVCVANCPSEAVSLKKKETVHVPPETFEELYAQIDKRRKESEKSSK